MITRLDRLARKRRALLRRSECLRRRAVELAVGIETRLLSFERIAAVVARSAKHPLVPLAVIAGLMLIGPRRALRWIGRGLIAFDVMRRVRALLAR